MPDINLHSFNGPDCNGQSIDWSDRTVLPGSEIADTIKCSTGLRDFSLRLGTVVGGREDALDVNNHCCNLDIHADRWFFEDGHSRMGFTVKGDSHNIRISGEIVGDPLVDLGNASDQSHVWCTGVRLNLRRASGLPVRVRVLAASYPIEEPGSGPYKYVFPSNIRWSPLRRFLMKCFLELRRWGIGRQKRLSA